jgi:CheY-specific phosphatase CheX
MDAETGTGVNAAKGDRQMVETVRDAVINHAVSYFKDVFGKPFSVSAQAYGPGQTVPLRDMTAMVALGGLFNLAVAFSFADSMIQEISRMATIGIRVEEGEHDIMVRETAADVVNEVVGLSTVDLGEFASLVSMSSPVVISGARQVAVPAEALVCTAALQSHSGRLDVWFVRPMTLFDERCRMGSA